MKEKNPEKKKVKFPRKREPFPQSTNKKSPSPLPPSPPQNKKEFLKKRYAAQSHTAPTCLMPLPQSTLVTKNNNMRPPQIDVGERSKYVHIITWSGLAV